MLQKLYSIGEVVEGKNSVLFQIADKSIFYEKLANTIHVGERQELLGLQEEVEALDYYPTYEAETLKKKRGSRLEGLLLNVTESCNLACRYCIYSGSYENERTENNSEMSFETAKKAIDLFIPRSEDRALIAFYGGEPLNNTPLINKVIAYVRKIYPSKETVFSMTTNFYNADKHIADLVKQEIYLNVSLDGPKEVHDKFRIHRNGNPTWDKIMENLRKLEDFSPRYTEGHVGMSASCADPDDFNKIVNYFLENEQFKVIRMGGLEQKGLKCAFGKGGVPLDVYNFAQKYLEYISSEKMPPNILRNFFDQKLKMISGRSRKEMPETLMLNGSCYPGKRKLFVDTDGQFYMCEKFGRRVSIGHVDEGIKQGAVDDSINRFQEIRNDLCTSGCWAQRLCTPCIHSAKDPERDLSIEGLSYTCRPSKQEILISLLIYTRLSQKDNIFFREYLKTINTS